MSVVHVPSTPKNHSYINLSTYSNNKQTNEYEFGEWEVHNYIWQLFLHDCFHKLISSYYIYSSY